MSSRVIFGAAALGGMSQQRADEVVLPLLFEHGINHIDTAAGYGESELRLAPWLVDHREKFFLATKTDRRTGDEARAELELSLERLGVDSVDLIQLHNLVEDDQWTTAHGPGGAVEALIAARDEGLVGHIGVTGHGLRIAGMHSRSLAEFDFDSVLLPYSWLLMENPAYRHDVEELLETCAEREVAVQTIKAVARRRWVNPSDARFSWYEPLSDEAAIARSVRHVLSTSQLFLNTSSDARLLPAIIAGATAPIIAPSASELADDVTTHAMAPLFDGSELEVI
ncbi:MAG: aldo/keto reductase [Acidimicrobiales bacterium]